MWWGSIRGLLEQDTPCGTSGDGVVRRKHAEPEFPEWVSVETDLARSEGAPPSKPRPSLPIEKCQDILRASIDRDARVDPRDHLAILVNLKL